MNRKTETELSFDITIFSQCISGGWGLLLLGFYKERTWTQATGIFYGKVFAPTKKNIHVFSLTHSIKKKGGGAISLNPFYWQLVHSSKLPVQFVICLLSQQGKKIRSRSQSYKKSHNTNKQWFNKTCRTARKKFTSLNVYIVKQRQMKPRTIYDVVVKYIRKPWIGVLKITMVVSQIKHSIVEIQKNIRI